MAEPLYDFESPSKHPSLMRRLDSLVLRGWKCFGIAVGLIATAWFLDFFVPRGIWFFGHKPQWIIALDFAGLTIGPFENPICFGRVPVIVIEIIVAAVVLRFVFLALRKLRCCR